MYSLHSKLFLETKLPENIYIAPIYLVGFDKICFLQTQGQQWLSQDLCHRGASALCDRWHHGMGRGLGKLFE